MVNKYLKVTRRVWHKSLAFTLAEVLITLAIIGVVAALTIPTLITNYQHSQYITQLKKVQSTMSQAFTQMIANNENILRADQDGDGHGDVTDCAANYIEREYDIIKKYFKTINVTIPSSVPVAYSLGGTEMNGFYFKKGNDDSISLAKNKFILADGTFMSYGCTPSEFFYEKTDRKSDYTRTMTVDINGPYKKPNKEGYDIFVFAINKYGSVVPGGAIIDGEHLVDILVDGNIIPDLAFYALRGYFDDGRNYWDGIKDDNYDWNE